MTLAEIRDWLKTLEAAENYYIGRIENKKERSIGVYEGTAAGRPVMALGGLKNSSYDIRAVSLLLHWNRNKNETEIAARSLWDKLIEVNNVDAGENHIQYLQMTVPEPIGVGTDGSGVYEYVINFNLYYRR